jgi:hypothetical protein
MKCKHQIDWNFCTECNGFPYRNDDDYGPSKRYGQESDIIGSSNLLNSQEDTLTGYKHTHSGHFTDMQVDGGESTHNLHEAMNQLETAARRLVDDVRSDIRNTQIAGTHYTKLGIQPMEYALANNFNYLESFALKYLSRHRNKNGIEDLKKALHCIELLIEVTYEPGRQSGN